MALREMKMSWLCGRQHLYFLFEIHTHSNAHGAFVCQSEPEAQNSPLSAGDDICARARMGSTKIAVLGRVTAQELA